MMEQNIDFTSDEPSDQKGIMTNFEESKGQKRKLEDMDTGETAKNGNSQNG